MGSSVSFSSGVEVKELVGAPLRLPCKRERASKLARVKCMVGAGLMSLWSGVVSIGESMWGGVDWMQASYTGWLMMMREKGGKISLVIYSMDAYAQRVDEGYVSLDYGFTRMWVPAGARLTHMFGEHHLRDWENFTAVQFPLIERIKIIP